jgi:ketol-acid reductoisomerase
LIATRRAEGPEPLDHDEERELYLTLLMPDVGVRLRRVTTIYREHDADPDTIKGATVAVVGYGNQGRSWALNLRDSGLDVRMCARADDSRKQAESDGFDVGDIEQASSADVVCCIVPDDAISVLPITPKPEALVIVASGYAPAFDNFDPGCDVAMIAPRMLGPEVRSCYEQGVGFITAVGVQHDRSGNALARTLAVAHAIGGLKQGALALTPMQEAVLDLAVEQALSPALRHVNNTFVQVMLENGIPLEAVMTELILSGEVERTYRLLRLEGYAAQMAHHSPISQYGQLSRADYYSHLDVVTRMREIVDNIADGGFAKEWDGERDADHPTLTKLRDEALPPELFEWERHLRQTLGEAAVETT